MSVLNDKNIDNKLLLGQNYGGLYVDEVKEYGINLKQENLYMGLYDINNLIEISKDLNSNNLFAMYIDGGMDLSLSSEHTFDRNIEICIEGDVSLTNEHRYSSIQNLFLFCNNLNVFESSLNLWDCSINGGILQLSNSHIFQETGNSNLNFQLVLMSRDSRMTDIVNDCWNHRYYCDYGWSPWKTLELPQLNGVHTIFIDDCGHNTLVFQKRDAPVELDDFYQMVVVNDEWNFMKFQCNIDSFDFRRMVK